MPNQIPGNVGFLVYPNMHPVTAAAGTPPTTFGHGMLPNTVVPLIEGHVFSARGVGVWDLDEPNVPPLDARFTRGPRLNGRAGTMDIRTVLGNDGTARTLCYLTDNPQQPGNVIAVRVDSQNRPYLSLNQGVAMPVPAGGNLDFTGGNATNTEDVTIDTKTYTFQAVLTDVDGNVLIGATPSDTIDNLIAAINLEPWGAGVVYAASTTAHPTCFAYRQSATLMGAESKQAGTVGNAIATTENILNVHWVNGLTMIEGTDGDLVTEAEITPAGPWPAVPPGTPLHLRMAWDSVNRIPGTSRHVSFAINGEPVVAPYWSTDPLTPWDSWQPTHLVLGGALEGLYLEPAYNGVIQAVQVSNLVLP